MLLTDYYLLGESQQYFPRRKLPTIKDVLLVFLNHFNSSHEVKKSVNLTADYITDEVIQIWKSKNLAVRKKGSIKNQIKKIYQKWLRLKLGENKVETVLKRAQKISFKKSISIIFDISAKFNFDEKKSRKKKEKTSGKEKKKKSNSSSIARKIAETDKNDEATSENKITDNRKEKVLRQNTRSVKVNFCNEILDECDF